MTWCMGKNVVSIFFDQGYIPYVFKVDVLEREGFVNGKEALFSGSVNGLDILDIVWDYSDMNNVSKGLAYCYRAN